MVAVCAAESVTLAVKLAVPVAVAVPVIWPVVPSSESPAGSEPEEMLQVYAGVPPVACSVAEYSELVEACGREDVVIDKGTGPAAAATAMLNALAEALWSASSTCTVNDAVPAAVGAPEITPEEAARVTPTGSEPEMTLQVYGVVPPLACSVAEYAVPTLPPASADVEIAGTEERAMDMLSALMPELFAASVT